jgi:hypothetical protein
MDTVVILIGVGCIIGAIIGGGLKIQVMEMGKLDSLWRQLLLAIFGSVLIYVGWNMKYSQSGVIPETTVDTTDATDASPPAGESK